jgi:hypothetical protein
VNFVIIPSDGFVSVNGRGIDGFDLSDMADDVHAVVWSEDAGDVQIKGPGGQIVENRRITSMTEYQPVLDAWEAARDAIDSPPAEPLQDRRDAAWVRVKAIRTTVEDGGALAGGHWFQTDTASRIKLMRLDTKATAALALGGSPTDVLTVAGNPVAWKSAENVLVPMTIELAQAITLAVEVLDAQAYGHAEQLRAQIMASETPESVDITAGWPAVFQG